MQIPIHDDYVVILMQQKLINDLRDLAERLEQGDYLEDADLVADAADELAGLYEATRNQMRLRCGDDAPSCP